MHLQLTPTGKQSVNIIRHDQKIIQACCTRNSPDCIIIYIDRIVKNASSGLTNKWQKLKFVYMSPFSVTLSETPCSQPARRNNQNITTTNSNESKGVSPKNTKTIHPSRSTMTVVRARRPVNPPAATLTPVPCATAPVHELELMLGAMLDTKVVAFVLE